MPFKSPNKKQFDQFKWKQKASVSTKIKQFNKFVAWHTTQFYFCCTRPYKK